MSRTDKDRPFRILLEDPPKPKCPCKVHAWTWRAPPKWSIDHHWNNPERVRVREFGRAAMKEYRATRDVELELLGFQHRHNACWYYHW